MTNDDLEREARLEAGRRALENKGVHVDLQGGLGGSPVPTMEQLRQAAITLVHETVPDGDGALVQVFVQDVRQEEALFAPLAHALVTHGSPDALRRELLEVLGTLAGRVLANEHTLADFTRRVDAAWGQLFCERPRFQAVGEQPHPEDAYTHESVRAALARLVGR